MEIVRSDKPILTVFTKKYATDQYGGYLGLSVFVYRVFIRRRFSTTPYADLVRSGSRNRGAISLDAVIQFGGG